MVRTELAKIRPINVFEFLLLIGLVVNSTDIFLFNPHKNHGKWIILPPFYKGRN